mmetsp:Transcript_10401/g.24486  ORF Transcript_10401/g.24486 Transcript_10401/m.24486 type:complete len:85 (-) Transcript_10401:9-263(-)
MSGPGLFLCVGVLSPQGLNCNWLEDGETMEEVKGRKLVDCEREEERTPVVCTAKATAWVRERTKYRQEWRDNIGLEDGGRGEGT